MNSLEDILNETRPPLPKCGHMDQIHPEIQEFMSRHGCRDICDLASTFFISIPAAALHAYPDYFPRYFDEGIPTSLGIIEQLADCCFSETSREYFSDYIYTRAAELGADTPRPIHFVEG